jgi:hypothetical protein
VDAGAVAVTGLSATFSKCVTMAVTLSAARDARLLDADAFQRVSA